MSLGNRSENFVGSENKTYSHGDSDGFDQVEVDSEKGKCGDTTFSSSYIIYTIIRKT